MKQIARHILFATATSNIPNIIIAVTKKSRFIYITVSAFDVNVQSVDMATIHMIPKVETFRVGCGRTCQAGCIVDFTR